MGEREQDIISIMAAIIYAGQPGGNNGMTRAIGAAEAIRGKVTERHPAADQGTSIPEAPRPAATRKAKGGASADGAGA